VASLKKSRTNPISLVPLLLHSQVLIKKKNYFFLLMKHVLSYCICIFFSILWSWLLKYEFSLFFILNGDDLVMDLQVWCFIYVEIIVWCLSDYYCDIGLSIPDPQDFQSQIMPFVMRWICHLIRRICVLATLFSIWRT
jgi:hypothetical protein